jgi:hypothetical protein
MTAFRGSLIVLVTSLLSGVVVATDFPRTPPKNLQVLPKDTSTAALRKVMRRFERDLGVQCTHCHVENAGTQELDYVSDENPRKVTARLMMSMLTDINDKYLAQVGGDRRYAVPVSCGSCHQGHSTPPQFESEW